MLRNWLLHPWLWSALLAAAAAAPAGAQPPPPLELVRGLREHGHLDLAMEYLKDLEGKPLSAEDKAGLLLERAKCLLAASEDEPDEATRVGMVSEAREGLRTFLVRHANHPRAVEARLTEAKLTAMDAREQLNRARRMDVPPPSENDSERAAREAAMAKQKQEAKKARPLFLLAAKQFAAASTQLRAKLDDKALDPLARRTLEREAFEAELASGINQFNTAETYMPSELVTGAEKVERNKFLELAKDTFRKLGDGPQNSRTVWVARAWVAQVTYEQNDDNAAAAEVKAILRAPLLEAQDGKRLARFFQLQRNFLTALSERNRKKVDDSLNEIRYWREHYDNPRRPTPEAFAVHYYEGRLLQAIGESDKGALTTENRKRLEQAEKLYRGLTQTDNEYTARATRQRMSVVRKLLGDAEKPASAYDKFEEAQMASLIQLGKLAQAEAMPEMRLWSIDLRAAEVKNRQLKTIALLERSRELATPQDSPADVHDVLLRLIYFYQLSGQPYQAAVLGEHVAHTMKATGGKAAAAGWLSLSNYLAASRRARGEGARQADRGRAVAVARFLDEKYPNDGPTDTARHQLASLYLEDKRPQEAFDTLLKVRPSYAQITNVRLLEGYLAAQLVAPRDSALPEARKAEIFKRAVADLAKVSKPAPVALEDDVRGYVSARCRLAQLMLAQGRADPAAEKARPGYDQALAVADGVVRDIPTFNALTTGKVAGQSLNLDGLEMMMLAQDAQARATYLRARGLIDAADDLPDPAARQQKYDEAARTLLPIVGLVQKSGPLFTPEMKAWSVGAGDDKDTVQKARIAELAGKVDKTRVDVILADFRLKVKQAKGAEAAALLNLIEKAGGSIENSLPLLEPVGRELAVQLAVLRKEGRKAEADALAAGLAVLLNKITTVKKLPESTILFVGQMLVEVGQCDKAIEMLKRIGAPEFANWQNAQPNQIPAELRGRVQVQIRDYASAQFGIARALLECKKFKEAEELLAGVVGTTDKPGWGANRLYFRKLLAQLHEGKGAALASPKEANVEWGKALKEWTTLFSIQRARLSKLPPLPKGATADQKAAHQRQLAEYRNAFADSFLDVNRCLVAANQQLLKAAPPEKLQKTYADVARRLGEMEKQIPAAEWQPEVQHRYAELLKDTPPLMAAYRAGGGKFFLEKIPVQ
jgi:hypothetical protein